MSQAVIAALGDVSGTAYWVARYRALETEGKAPLFKDPWAAQLAGERGRTILEQMPAAKILTWAFVMRTAILDRMITTLLTRDGFDTVINLAAGLDTRAYRLNIPAEVQWFDVDTQAIIEHKRSILANTPPRCRWETIATDLSEDRRRRALLAELGARGRKVLAISEGLLHYLSEHQVDALACDLHDIPPIQSWVFDMNSRASMEYAQRLWSTLLSQVNAQLQFAPLEGTEFFRTAGWREAEHVSLASEAVRVQRLPLIFRTFMSLARYVAPAQYRGFLASGIARLERCLKREDHSK